MKQIQNPNEEEKMYILKTFLPSTTSDQPHQNILNESWTNPTVTNSGVDKKHVMCVSSILMR